MQISSINNYSLRVPNRIQTSNRVTQDTTLNNQQVNFTGDKNYSKAIRNGAIAVILLPASLASLPSCTKVYDVESHASSSADAYAHAYVKLDTLKYQAPADTIYKWYDNYKRPQPLDSLFNNFGNWDIPGTDGDITDSLANRNIIHYEGVRQWEENDKEIGDINMLESYGKNLVYDVEVYDYKDNFKGYEKAVLRIPTSEFTVTKKDGTVLNSPKGCFFERYENNSFNKTASIQDCELKSRAFVTTDGDTLRVARLDENNFIEKGTVSKGYIGDQTVLLKNLIGRYPTDDHYVDFKIEAVDDRKLKEMYVDAMDKEYY